MNSMTTMDKIKVNRLERYREQLQQRVNENPFDDSTWYLIKNFDKAILYFKGDKTQTFDPTLIEDIVNEN